MNKNPMTKTNYPTRFYWDGIKLWGIYEGIYYNRKNSSNKKTNYYKGSVEEKELEKLEIFKSFSSSIPLEQAEEIYPEYFL